ncbi:MAG: class I SAM-dependent methyltransferase, partial [Thermoleophilia bacterium]|nr:class I SAM-dependent methyltransferase [Thermoleophilia bacterium]
MRDRDDDAAATTVDANRRFYAEAANRYDSTEECVVDPRLRERLRLVLTRALRELPPEPRALDACGGSGNVSLLLLEHGISPVTVDVSPEMLAIYERKASVRGWATDTRVAEVGDFLAATSERWDLIVFSSALHHLEDYRRTLELSVAHLAPGGILVTIFDPTRVGRLGEKLRRLDYIAHVFVKTPRRVPSLVARRVRGRPRGGDETPVGARAERHALEGVDDLAIRGTFETAGLEILVHGREYEGRFALTRLLFRAL